MSENPDAVVARPKGIPTLTVRGSQGWALVRAPPIRSSGKGGTVSWADDRERRARRGRGPQRARGRRRRHRRRRRRPRRADRGVPVAGAGLELLDGRAGGLGPEMLPKGLGLQALGGRG